MRLLPATLALALLLGSVVPGGGVSLESLLTNMKCRCIKATAKVINLGLILAIDVTPPGIHCRRKEIILTLRRNKKVCVAPEAPWIQLLLHKLMQRYQHPTPSSISSGSGRPLPLTAPSASLSNPQICRNATKRQGASRPRREAERGAGGAGRGCWSPCSPPAPSLPLSRYDGE